VAVTCKEFLSLLDEEGGTLPAAALAHAASCPACGLALERWRAVKAELRAMAAEPAPEILAARVMAAVRRDRHERAHPARTAWWRLRLAPALAMLAVATLGGGYLLLQALRAGPVPTQQAHLESGREDKRKAPSLDAAGEGKAAPHAVPAAPALGAPRPRHAPGARTTDERGGARPVAAGSIQGFAPEPPATATVEPPVIRDEPEVAGGVAGGVLAPMGAPAAGRPVAAAEDSRVARTDHQPAGRSLAKLDATSQVVGATPVRVVLATLDGVTVTIVHTVAASSPAVGSYWLVAVGADRRIVLRDADGRDVSALHPEMLALLRGASLASGTYRLSR
jgi:hypothetical protein